MKRQIGVLMMAYGGPNGLEEIPGYLADIRIGRVTTPAVLEEISENYRRIGGKSPLFEHTRAQVQAVADHFDPARFKFYLGMRHWSPWIEEVVGHMVEDGVRQAVALALAPHYSRLGSARYHQKIEDGLEMYHGRIEFGSIYSYHDAPGLIRAFANRVEEGLGRWPKAERKRVHVVFSAHSLPARILEMGDPYDAQVRETARLVAEEARLPRERWSWSYQSAGRSPEPWLGPQLDEHLVELAGRGIRNVVSVPIGFVCDHVEIVYDIDIRAQEIARRQGIRLERPPALNTDPLFIGTLVELIREKAGLLVGRVETGEKVSTVRPQQTAVSDQQSAVGDRQAKARPQPPADGSQIPDTKEMK
jgi:ferrochelatase